MNVGDIIFHDGTRIQSYLQAAWLGAYYPRIGNNQSGGGRMSLLTRGVSKLSRSVSISIKTGTARASQHKELALG